MLVCYCRSITEHQVRRAVRQGAHTLRELGRSCGAGSGCGGCRQRLRRILADERASQAEAEGSSLPLELSPAR